MCIRDRHYVSGARRRRSWVEAYSVARLADAGRSGAISQSEYADIAFVHEVLFHNDIASLLKNVRGVTNDFAQKRRNAPVQLQGASVFFRSGYRIDGHLRTVIGNDEMCIRDSHCDLYWSEQNVAIEYNSREFHVNELAVERDASRINNLKAAGIEALAVTRAHVADNVKSDAIAHSAASLMGKRIRIAYVDIDERRMSLRKQLFSKDPWC